MRWSVPAHISTKRSISCFQTEPNCKGSVKSWWKEKRRINFTSQHRGWQLSPAGWDCKCSSVTKHYSAFPRKSCSSESVVQHTVTWLFKYSSSLKQSAGWSEGTVTEMSEPPYWCYGIHFILKHTETEYGVMCKLTLSLKGKKDYHAQLSRVVLSHITCATNNIHW